MQMSASKARALEFPIGDKTYVVPPAGIDAGIKLADVFSNPTKAKLTNLALFKLAIGPVWDEMQTDGVPYTEAWRLAMACLAREQTLLRESGPDRWDLAEKAAAALWESGADPEALAAWMAAAVQSETKPSTRTGAANTTRSPASGTGTRKANSTNPKPGSRSRGTASSRRGRS